MGDSSGLINYVFISAYLGMRASARGLGFGFITTIYFTFSPGGGAGGRTQVQDDTYIAVGFDFAQISDSGKI